VRDALIFLIFFASIPMMLKRPMFGMLAYAVVSLMNPHRLTYGAAYSFQFAQIIVGITLLGILLSRDKKQMIWSPAVVALLLFNIWMFITFLFALEPQNAIYVGDRVLKIMMMVWLTIWVVRTKEDVKWLAVAVALSLGFWGAKSGIFTIKSGGTAGVMGPAGSFIGDNNTLALAMVTTVPLLVYLISRAPNKWFRRAAIALTLLTAIGAIGSYSRGALVGAVCMGLFLWLKSSSKFKTGLLIAVLAPAIFLSMPEEWTGRMNTINNYEEDQSAQGRINSWGFAINIATENPLGGGFGVFTPRMFRKHAPNPNVFFVAHSIYFQVLGEHGYIGLFLFLSVFVCGWRTGTRVIKHCRGRPDLEWAALLARMCQVSMIGYLSAGAFLTLAYYDLIYYVLVILIGLEKVLIRFPQADDASPVVLPFGWGSPKPAAIATPSAGVTR